MAESLIALTEGSGKNLHTFQRVIGVNTVEDQIVGLGEQYLAGYTVVSGVISTATAASHLGQIMAGSSLKARIRRIELYQTGAATTATLMQVDVLRLTTAGTGGTSLTPNPSDTTDAAAGSTGMTLPSAKGTEGALLWRGAAYMMQTVAASSQLAEPILAIELDWNRSKPWVIAAGTTNGICIKNVTGVAGGTVAWTAWLDESNF